MRKVNVFRFFVDTQNDNCGDAVKRCIPTQPNFLIFNFQFK